MATARRMRLPVMLKPTLTGEPRLPMRAHPDDAGWDLFVSERTVVPPGGFVDVPSGVHVEIPNGYWGMLTGRSSTVRRRGLLVVQGIIDTGYRGELFSAVQNLRQEETVLEVGERVAQFILLPNVTASTILKPVESLNTSTRGSHGFGSSGV